MGRRMKSTKSGKYINPTDQARKEARKRELKKNKKQRLIVRVAVLKGKDPYQIIADLERLDRMEYDFYNLSSLNEKVLKDKRRKLRETWDRVCRLYSKEDRDKFLELKRLEGDYESKRNELVKQYEAVKSAQEVNLEDIPLPSIPIETSSKTSSSILKNKPRTKQPPGCPPGLPPSIKEFCEDDENSENEADDSRRKIRFSDEVEDKNKEGSNLQKFLQEIEQLSTDKPKDEKDNKNVLDEETVTNLLPSVPVPPNVLVFGSSAGQVQPAPPILLQPPPRAPTVPMISPQIQVTAPLVHQSNQVIRVPVNPMFGNHSTKTKISGEKKQVATIEARPQLRNLSADATKFMPLTLRVRRDEKQPIRNKPLKPSGYGMINSYSSRPDISTSSSYQSSLNEKDKATNSKDDAYEQFMKEMNGLI